jgi:hypothetical protein
MAARRGNSTSYPGDGVYDICRDIWNHRDKTLDCRAEHERAKDVEFSNTSLNGRAVVTALNFLATALGEEDFQRAADKLYDYGLAAGGLRQEVLCFVKEGRGTAVWMGFECMHELIRDGCSNLSAAAQTAALCQIPGKTFQAVTDDLRKNYHLWVEEEINGECMARHERSGPWSLSWEKHENE